MDQFGADYESMLGELGGTGDDPRTVDALCTVDDEVFGDMCNSIKDLVDMVGTEVPDLEYAENAQASQEEIDAQLHYAKMLIGSVVGWCRDRKEDALCSVLSKGKYINFRVRVKEIEELARSTILYFEKVCSRQPITHSGLANNIMVHWINLYNSLKEN